jgi:hypothetical protein
MAAGVETPDLRPQRGKPFLHRGGAYPTLPHLRTAAPLNIYFGQGWHGLSCRTVRKTTGEILSACPELRQNLIRTPNSVIHRRDRLKESLSFAKIRSA